MYTINSVINTNVFTSLCLITRRPYQKLLARKWQNNSIDSASPVTIATSPPTTSVEKRNTNQSQSSASTPLTSKRLTNKVFRPVAQNELNGNLKPPNVCSNTVQF